MMPENLNQWLLALTVVVILIDRLINFYKSHMKESPDPSKTYATKEEVVALQAADRESRTRREQDRKDDEDRQIFYRREIYEKIEDTNKAVAALQAEITGLSTGQELMNQRLVQIDNKLDRKIEANKT